MGNFEDMARRLAEQYVRKGYEDGNAELDEAATRILDATAPLTMEGVQWDDEKHYLAGATDAGGHEVVMLGPLMSTIRVCDVDDVNGVFAPVLENPRNLTPNGKRYELREKGGRPTELSSEGEYRDAPLGTVIAEPVGYPWIKTTPDGWESGGLTRNCQGMFEGGPHQVLRMGDGT